jgi:hypothetical protein
MTLQIDRYLDPLEPVDLAREYIYNDVDLAGVAWNYRLHWNDRAERWQLDVWTTDGTKAIYGKRLVPNYPLLWAHTGRRPEGGDLVLIDTGDSTGAEQCTFDGLGWRWKLAWIVDDGVAAVSTRPWVIT